MNKNNYKSLFSVVPMLLVLSACAGTPDRAGERVPGDTPYEVTEDYNSGVIRYTVQRGDRLGSIAQEYTGRSSNWREIAEYNNISNPRSLHEGQVLEIPTDLIPGYQRPTTVPVNSAESNRSSNVQPSALALRTNNAADVAPVVVTPTHTNRDFQLNPIDPNAATQSSTYNGSGAQIKVVGTYYPKGIYTEPAAYSKLIMRVAPGTMFVLDSQVNEWYKIETNGGTGYIRTSDASIVE